MWGKIIGSFAGFAMGGPFGALFGAAAGHAYDRMHEEAWHTHLPPWSNRTASMGGASYQGGSEKARQMAFSIAVVVLGAKVAKVDGPVNRAEIDAFKEVFRVPPQETRNVGRVYNAAKQNATGFEPYAQQLAILFRGEPALLEDLLASLFYIARSDGEIRTSEMTFLHRVADLFGLDARTFDRVRAMFTHSGGACDPYGILGLSPTASDNEVKNTYRRLIREHHPDSILAKGLPRRSIQIANQKMAAINTAYDQIKRDRRLR